MSTTMRADTMQKKEKQPVKRIKQISVKNLFGIFNHTIPLNLDERLTIVHSPNGFGKTMMLKLLNELFSQSTRLLGATPFEEFRVDFDDGKSFWVKKEFQENIGLLDVQKIIFSASEEKPISTIDYFDISPIKSRNNNTFVVDSDTISPGYFFDIKGEDIFGQESTGFDVLVSRNPLPEIELLQRVGRARREKESTWLDDMRKVIPIRLIETQRLLYLREKNASSSEGKAQSAIPTVTLYAQELAEKVTAKLAESANLAQSLDRTFPERVFNPTIELDSIDIDELRRRLAEIGQKRSRLMSIGLLDQGESATLQLREHEDESKKIMLSVYVEDTEKKLSIFDDLAKKIELLSEIINNRFLYKKLTIDKDQGFVFTSANDTGLPLENLSSGEQHELVLFYELLFHVDPGSLILIDEPEISLHVVWQEQFLRDVQAVTRITNTDVIIATHSPDIIADRRDLVVELKGPNDGQLP